MCSPGWHELLIDKAEGGSLGVLKCRIHQVQTYKSKAPCSRVDFFLNLSQTLIVYVSLASGYWSLMLWSDDADICGDNIIVDEASANRLKQ